MLLKFLNLNCLLITKKKSPVKFIFTLLNVNKIKFPKYKVAASSTLSETKCEIAL